MVQSDVYNTSRLGTVIVAAMTSNTALAGFPGNVVVPAWASGLREDSVVLVTILTAVDKTELDDPVGQVPALMLDEVARGLKRVLAIR